MENETVNAFTWMIKNYESQKDDILRSDAFQIKGENESCWYLLVYKAKDQNTSSNVVTFQLEAFIRKTISSNFIKIKLSLGSVGKRITISKTMRPFSGFEFFIKEEMLLTLLNQVGTLCVKLTIKSQRQKKNFNLHPTREKQLIAQQNFKPFVNNQSFSDVVLKIDDCEFLAHKIILASVSSVFRKMFSDQVKKGLPNVVILKETNPDDFKELLDYIYTGKVENLNEAVFGLYDLANKYDVSDLRKICEDHLNNSLSVDNVINVLQLADRQNSVKLKNECMEFIDRHFDSVQMTEPFKALNRGLLMDLLCAIKVKKPKK